MPLPLLALAGAGALAGLLKSEFVDKPNEDKDREIQSITDRYSPWTGMRGKMVERTNPLGEAVAMGAQGAALGQGLNSAASQDTLNNAIADKIKSETAGVGLRADGSGPSLFNDPNTLNFKSQLGSDLLSQDARRLDPLTLALVAGAQNNRRYSGLV